MAFLSGILDVAEAVVARKSKWKQLRAPIRRPRPRTRFQQPGVAPGELIADPRAAASAVRVFGYGPDEYHEDALDGVQELSKLKGRWPCLWVNVDGLGDVTTLQAIADVFDIHPLAMEDVVNIGQRPKLEDYAGNIFMVARQTLPDGSGTEQLSLFIGPGVLVTFQESMGDVFDGVRERLRSGRTRIRSSGPDYLAYALVDAVVDAYFPLMERFADRLDDFETAIMGRPDTKLVTALHAIRRDLLSLRRGIWPLRDVVNSMMRDDSDLVVEETRLFLRDVYDHTVRVIDLVETYRELAAGLMDMYLSIVSHRMNEIMKVLTIISTIFIPLTFIAGIYGMNFDPGSGPLSMPELASPWGYPIALGAMAIIAICLVVFFRRRGWIGRADMAPLGHDEHAGHDGHDEHETRDRVEAHDPASRS